MAIPCVITSPGSLNTSNNVSDNSNEMTLDAPLLLFLLHLHDASTPVLLRYVGATDRSLLISHASVYIDVLDFDIQWPMRWSGEPAIDFPNQEQENEQRTSEIELEERAGIQVRAANRIQRNIELSDKADDVDEQAQI